MLWPNGTVTQPRVSSSYGPRNSSTPGASKFHRGTDFIGFSAIKAVADGTVVAVGTPQGWTGGGTQVWVQHSGFLSRSLHMRKGSPIVKVGQKVKEGQTLGVMGNTGVSGGVHLHLEIVVNGVQVDPVPYISARLSRPAGGGGSVVPTPTPEPILEEDDEMKPLIIHRKEGNPEWSLVHPDYRGPGEQERGYLVTTDQARAIAWARMHGKGWGNPATYTASVDRAGYMDIQAAARAEYDAKQAVRD